VIFEPHIKLTLAKRAGQAATDLYILAKILQASVGILISRVLATVNSHFSRQTERRKRVFCEMPNLVDIVVTNLLAFSAVVRIQSGNGGSCGKEDQPVARREFGTLVEP
jgi:hypothetical protein